MILFPHVFYSRGPQTGLILFLTDDSSAERNALELCYPKGIRLLCTFHILQAFWRWIYDSKHNIKKEDHAFIMAKMKKIVYASSSMEMDTCYFGFKQEFYHSYPSYENILNFYGSVDTSGLTLIIQNYLHVEIIQIITLKEVLEYWKILSLQEPKLSIPYKCFSSLL